MSDIVAIILILALVGLVGYYMHLVMAGKKAAGFAAKAMKPDESEDGVASESQLSSGSMAGAAVYQPELSLDNFMEYNNETAQDFELPLSLMVDYLLGRLGDESSKSLQRKFAEQFCYLNPPKGNVTKADFVFAIEKPDGQMETLFSLEDLQNLVPDPRPAEEIKAQAAARAAARRKTKAKSSKDESESSLFEGEEESGVGVEGGVQEQAPASVPSSSLPDSDEDDDVDGAGGVDHSGFVMPPVPEEASEVADDPEQKPDVSDVSGVHQPSSGPSSRVEPGSGDSSETVEEGSTEEMKGVSDGEVDSEVMSSGDEDSNVVYGKDLFFGSLTGFLDDGYSEEDQEEPGGEDDGGAGGIVQSHFDDESEDESDSPDDGTSDSEEGESVEESDPDDKMKGIPEDVVEILRNPIPYVVPYCMYANRRFSLGLDFGTEWDYSRINPVLSDIKVFCRELTREEFFSMIRVMMKVGLVVESGGSMEDALRAGGLKPSAPSADGNGDITIEL